MTSSRRLGFGDAVDGSDEGFPNAALCGEHLPAFTGHAVEASPPFTGFFDPFAFDPPSLLEPVEQRIERRGVECKDSVGPGFNQLADLIAVALAASNSERISNSALPFFNSRSSCFELIYVINTY
jgi:hypothetical protein